LNDKLLQIFIELPKFADSVEELREDSCFLDKFAVVMKRMAECETPPEIFGEGIFRRLFDAADLNGFNAQDKEQYKTAVMNELDYEATLYDFKERGRKEGLAQGLDEGEAKSKRAIAEKLKAMGLSAEQIKEATGIDI
ncbi:MAG: PD-(D/E)XK nuclease family transposase, partial [Bacteroidales bacterium]|nr:PD-(D/E)XK nuclease family transposase [Candidatus Egerieousia equi]